MYAKRAGHRNILANRDASHGGYDCSGNGYGGGVAFHALIHRLDQLPRTTRDLELLLRDDPLSADRIADRARQWRITRIAWRFLELLTRTDPGLCPSSTVASLAPPRIVRAAIRALVPDGETTRLHRLNHRVQAALLWPILFDSPLMTARFAAVPEYGCLRRRRVKLEEQAASRRRSGQANLARVLSCSVKAGALVRLEGGGDRNGFPSGRAGPAELPGAVQGSHAA